MSMETFVVVEVTVQLPFGFGSIRLIISVSVGIKLVALVIPPSGGSVLRPVPHTNPAELIFAAAARHVITPLILLNTRRTLGTRLRIGQDPIGSLRLVSTLLLPFDEIFARNGSMRLFSALEAEVSIALITMGHSPGSIGKDAPRSCGYGDLLASWARAPPCHSIRLHEGTELVTLKLWE
jgi:hypothetical protein